MAMEPQHNALSDYTNGFTLDDENMLPIFDQYPALVNGYRFRDEPLDLSFLDLSNPAPNPELGSSNSSSCLSCNLDSPDDFADCVFKYLNQILVEENMEGKQSMFHDPLTLQATEKSLYEALGEKYPPPPPPGSNIESPEENYFGSSSEYSTNSSIGGNSDVSSVAKSTVAQTPSLENPQLWTFGSNSSVTNDGIATTDSMINTHLVENIFTDSESILQFNKGMEEASKFLPPSKPIVVDLGKYDLPSNSRNTHVVKVEKVEIDNFRGRKHHKMDENGYEEERSSKQSAIYVEEEEISEMFDKVILCTDPGGPSMVSCHEQHPKQVNKKLQKNAQTYGHSSGWISHSLGQAMDVRTLLVNCAQSVASDDHRTAKKQLKLIRQHASPSGDASQRLAHIFAMGLEARLAGTGSKLYAAKSTLTISAFDKLKAYQVYLSACPFKKIAVFFANKMIYEAAATSSTLHIIDFGISYGFQWPVLIKHLAERPGGPPKLRITGIELPLPGFRPTDQLEETRRRLANYCERFKVPFEYNAIATQNWETIKVEELKLQRNECLAVNCLIRFKNLLDETVMVDSPRDGVLKLIRDMKPDIFVQTAVNGSYSAPFFVTRFKEALFHFSSIFDMFDASLDRNDEQRLNFEKEFCGREVMNVIACEDSERVERPETYKQWHVRNSRAGFKVIPLNKELVSKLKSNVKAGYHKDFVFDDDGNWVLQGWKGRILRASSCWVPA